MAEDTGKFIPTGNLFEAPRTKDILDFSTLLIQLFGEDQDLLFLLLHIVLMTFDAVPIQCLGHIGKLTGGISKLAARMRAMTESAGDALSVYLILFPHFV